MYLGDNVFVGGLAEPFAAFNASRPAVQLVVTKVANPSESGVAEIDLAGRVTSLEEKPADPKSDLAVTGAYFFTPAIHDAVRSIQPSGRNELEITDAVQWLVTKGRDVRAYSFSGQWKDTGSHNDLLECNKLLLETITPRMSGTVDELSHMSGPIVVEEGAVVRRSVLNGPAIIGAGCVVEDSYVGPYTSLGNDCRLCGAGVEYSILLERASIQGIRGVQESIIGRAGVVRQSRDQSMVRRLALGDDSVVEVPV
jgi:glucose-1-phosphate thymidylyltransferase